MKRVKLLKGTELSNFSPIGIVLKNKTWQTVEHMYQACKISPDREDNAELVERVRLCTGPAMAKRFGKRLPLRTDWQDVKIEKMRACLKLKFRLSLYHREKLLVAELPIVEYNYWHDNFWGICTCNKCQQRSNPGRNWLGKLLYDIRCEHHRLHSVNY